MAVLHTRFFYVYTFFTLINYLSRSNLLTKPVAPCLFPAANSLKPSEQQQVLPY